MITKPHFLIISSVYQSKNSGMPSQWVLTKCSIFGNCKVNDIYDPKVYILGSHNQLKMNFYHCKHFHKSRFTFFGNFAYVILESVNFKMIFQPSSGLRWLSGWILSEKLVFWRSVGLTVQFLDHFWPYFS